MNADYGNHCDEGNLTDTTEYIQLPLAEYEALIDELYESYEASGLLWDDVDYLNDSLATAMEEIDILKEALQIAIGPKRYGTVRNVPLGIDWRP